MALFIGEVLKLSCLGGGSSPTVKEGSILQEEALLDSRATAPMCIRVGNTSLGDYVAI